MPSRRRTRSRRPSLRSVRRAVEKSVCTIETDAFVRAYQKSGLRRLQPLILDREYRVASYEAVQLYLKWSKIDQQKYVAETFDCDDFAASLRGEARLKLKLNSVGEVLDFSGKHAYSVILTYVKPGGPLRFIVVEPQSDRIVEKRVGTGQYKAQRGFTVF